MPKNETKKLKPKTLKKAAKKAAKAKAAAPKPDPRYLFSINLGGKPGYPKPTLLVIAADGTTVAVTITKKAQEELTENFGKLPVQG